MCNNEASWDMYNEDEAELVFLQGISKNKFFYED